MPLQGHFPASPGIAAQSPALPAVHILKHLIKQGLRPCATAMLWKSTFVLYYINKRFITYKMFVSFFVPFLILPCTAFGERMDVFISSLP